MTTTPADDVATAIAARMPDLQAGSSLFVGDLSAPLKVGQKALMVSCRNTLGNGARAYADGGAGGRFERSSVQVLIRGDKNEPTLAEMIAERIKQAIHHKPLPGYKEAIVVGFGYNSLGPDPQGFPHFSLNIEMWRDVQELSSIFFGVIADPGVYTYASLSTALSVVKQSSRFYAFALGAPVAGRNPFVMLPASLSTPSFCGEDSTVALSATKVATLVEGAITFDVWRVNIVSPFSISYVRIQ